MSRTVLRRIITILLALAVVAAAVVVTLSIALREEIARLPGVGTTSVEAWCSRQLQAIAADLLRPSLTFDALDYVYPDAAILRGVQLVDGEIECVSAESIRVVFERIPRRGQPLRIRAIELERPSVNVHVRDDGTVAGFTDIIRDGGGRRRDDGGSTLPSDVIAIRRIAVADGGFQWQGTTGEPLVFDGLAFELTSEPERDPSQYEFDATFSREPVLMGTIRGRFNIDTALLELNGLAMNLMLGPDEYSALPSPLQERVRAHEIRGYTALGVRGTLPLKDMASASIRADLELIGANFVTGNVQWPVDRLSARIGIENQRLWTESLTAEIFGGSLDGTYEMDLVAPQATTVTLDARHLRFEDALRETAGDARHYTGDVSIEGRLAFEASGDGSALDGLAHVTIVDATLVGDPIFGGLMQVLGRDLATAGAGRDAGEADIAIRPDQAKFRSVKLTGDTIAARGEGEIGYDGRVNFRFNAGTIERVQEAIPIIGDILGAVTDRIVMYQVLGTVDEPEFHTRPLGFGAVPDS